eukprot:TRINITY_DN6743_c0_g2_i1.p1 TRINITY_DN6743_c0_g2~~TRINITY_DN6743_c0_g2_i1.p1  ORF type:complete len:685 (+),score=132.16 TRINITY_DN6743_c0_g2_i1:189-2243(+)
MKNQNTYITREQLESLYVKKLKDGGLINATVLGGGGSGMVLKPAVGLLEPIAVKKIPTSAMSSIEWEGHIKVQQHLLAIPYIGKFSLGQDTYIMMGQLSEGYPTLWDLLDNLEGADRKPYSEKRITWCKTMTTLMFQVFETDFIHQDLHLQNIGFMFDKLVLTEFGNGRFNGPEGSKFYTNVGQMRMLWIAAPETLVTQNQHYDHRKLDVWSFGILVIAVLTGDYPHQDGLPVPKYIVKVAADVAKELMKVDKSFAKWMGPLLKKMLVEKPKERLLPEQVNELILKSADQKTLIDVDKAQRELIYNQFMKRLDDGAKKEQAASQLPLEGSGESEEDDVARREECGIAMPNAPATNESEESDEERPKPKPRKINNSPHPLARQPKLKFVAKHAAKAAADDGNESEEEPKPTPKPQKGRINSPHPLAIKPEEQNAASLAAKAAADDGDESEEEEELKPHVRKSKEKSAANHAIKATADDGESEEEEPLVEKPKRKCAGNRTTKVAADKSIDDKPKPKIKTKNNKTLHDESYEVNIDKNIVQQLESVGFSKNLCKCATHATENAGADEAVVWLLQHFKDIDIAESHKKHSLLDEDGVSKSDSMGFTEEEAARIAIGLYALEEFENDVEEATAWIAENASEMTQSAESPERRISKKGNQTEAPVRRPHEAVSSCTRTHRKELEEETSS